MAEKKIIGRDALGNPIYEGGTLPNYNTARIGDGSSVNTARVGAGSTKPSGSGKPFGVVIDPKTGRNTGLHVGSAYKGSSNQISSKDASRNLQGAPQNTARSFIPGLGPAPQVPTVPELDAIRKKAAADAAAKAGGGGDPYANLLKALTGLGDYAAGNINDSMNTLASTLQGQANPFANYQAQSTTTTPELAQLLQSQGVSQDPLQQYAAAINAQSTGQASAFQNQANIMRDIYGASQAGSIADVGQQRADLLNQLQGNVLGAGKSLLGKNPANRNQVLQMILEAMKVQR